MDATETLTPPIPLRRGSGRIAALLGLVALADFLIFGQQPGINLFLFALAVCVGILLSATKSPSPLMVALLLGFSVLASAPLLEAPSPIGFALCLVALMSIALVSGRLMPRRLTGLPVVFFRFALVIPVRLAADIRKYLATPAKRSSLVELRRGVGLWIMPLILALVFVLLFAAANPLIESALRSIRFEVLLRLFDLWRIGFWMMIAIVVWAMLRPHLKRRAARSQAGRPFMIVPTRNTPLGHASLLRSLILFNALFAVQTLLDLVYLWGGADLPDHMSHAEYAHRGAYPLIATALLAAGFVLVAMRRGGPGDHSSLIRGLVHAWIGQNILLCLSSMLRLGLYVEVYSLTELRVAAGLWMGLVAIGLVLILLRILLNRSNEWLIAANLASLIAVLYISAFIDFPAVIARFNVVHSEEISQEGPPLDLDYLSSLGPSVIPALDLYLQMLPGYLVDKRNQALAFRYYLVRDFERRPRDWRNWTFRAARLETHLLSPAAIAR
ncbi:hypothetical protein BAE36_00135 [Rhizobium leguminosarum bv. trifolii]|jgi:hypothetical protein|uniref:Uncharacterized protein n=1 Tax=Rhizobium leguminosarum bv. trifolii TaxID=386 RepID=A0A1B8RJY9_RHILT|nr:DUF4173 domain-containing protein [Rhizobium leguminosarum]AOO87811.1 hypothetical protein [Rhizobium leguminosarum bv. trifolii]MBA8832447.1 hypothetical protein [Rhizobium leguminosarum]MDH6275068.1 hypothetical protein [Rhizobium leguminosarum]NKJ95933.1 DUF4173 domain-containing protein [Rhizobium leguminosarum bv. viciae]OBY09125.1 hypothetical protein BAE36_00135 [Rhizobium leguminosarum bv. trifolii]